MPFYNLPVAGGSPVLSGNGAPNAGLGIVGDLYIDQLNGRVYGPKQAGGWGSGFSIVGPAGPQGVANSLSIGTVTSGSTASATIAGQSPSQSISFVLPQGPAGSQGIQGPAGPANTLSIGQVTTSAPGSSASATITGQSPTQQLSLSIPRGEPGASGASSWSEITGKPSTFPPSTHTHTFADVSGLQVSLDGKAALSHAHAIGDVTGLQAALNGKQAAGTYATLVNGVVPASMLPSFVDDIVEYSSLASFPSIGESGKLYVALNTGKTYRWSGTSYSEISASPGSTDAVPEGANNLYFTSSRAVSAVQPQLDGKAAIYHLHSITDVTGLRAELDGKAALSHVHAVSQVTGLQSALDGKAALSHTHTVSQVTGLQTALDDKAAFSHAHIISQVTGLQAALDAKSPLSHIHVIADVTNLQATLTSLQTSIDGKAATSHAHIISQVTGLQAALDAKAPTSHSHVISDVTALQAALDGKSPLVHTHTVSQVTGLQAALDSKAALSHFHVIADVSGLQSALDAKASSSHTHTVSQVTNLQSLLDGKAASSHQHAIADVTGLQSALDGKSPASHGHDIDDVTGLQSALDGKAALSHFHAISNITGLQTALDGKASLSHVHAISDVTNLESRLQFASTLTDAPASDTAPGTAGQLALDANYLYGCITANTWRRIAWEAYGSAAAGIQITSQPSDQSTSTSSGVVSMTSTSPPFGDFLYSGMSGTGYALLAAFYANDSVQYATSSAYENLIFTRANSSSTWTGMLVNGSALNAAATYSGQIDTTTNPPTVPLHPYRHAAGNSAFTVLAREEYNPEYNYGSPMIVATTSVASTSPSFSSGSFFANDNTQYGISGVSGLAASPSMVVAGLIRYTPSYIYNSSIYNLNRVYSSYPLAYTTNGTNWATIATTQSAAVYDIVYSSGRFVAVGAVSGGAPYAWHSTNGLSWSAVELPTGTYVSIASGNGKIVAVGMPTNRVLYHGSSTGPFWRGRSVIDDGSLTQRVLVSSDNGLTWSAVGGLPILETWIKVAYVGGNVGRFVAFAASNQICAVSADGENWDPVSRGTSESVFGTHAVFGNSLYQPAGGYSYGENAWKMDFTVTGGGGGGAATFTVAATAAATISYQWQKSTDYGSSFSNISGANSASLALSGITIADNNSRYRCRLSAGGVTVFSNAAILTVSA